MKPENSIKIIDPSGFCDPIAMLTDWTPIDSEGTKGLDFYKLVKKNPNRLEIKETITGVLLNWFCTLMGCFVMLVCILKLSLTEVSLFDAVYDHREVVSDYLSEGEKPLFDAVFIFLIGLVFARKGGNLIYQSMKPIVFDKQKGVFQDGRKISKSTAQKNIAGCFTSLVSIHALQIIQKTFYIDRDPYSCYELNLVLENGSRLHVVSSSYLTILRQQATTIATFLNKPTWDAI